MWRRNMNTIVDNQDQKVQQNLLLTVYYTVGRSEKRKNWNFQKDQANSEQRHSTDFRTIDEIIIG